MQGTVMQALASGAPMSYAFVRVRRAGEHRDAEVAEKTLLDEFSLLSVVHLFVFRGWIKAAGEGQGSSFPSLESNIVDAFPPTAISPSIVLFSASLSARASLAALSKARVSGCRTKGWVTGVPFWVDAGGRNPCHLRRFLREGDAGFWA